MGLRVWILSRYSRLGASSRLRMLQYRPWLEAAGLEVVHEPFFDDAYLGALYAGRRRGAASLRHVLRRLAVLRRRPPPDLIWLEYETLPWLPWLLERSVLPRGVPIVSDYDDAVFLRYDAHRLAPVRGLLGGKIDSVMAASRLVLAGNRHLADHADAAGATRVERVPTVVDLDHYPPAAPPAEAAAPNRGTRIGWIGTPQTWAALARPIHDVVLPVLKAEGAVIRAIGASLAPAAGDHLEILPWSEAKEAELIRGTDIGIMPLPDTPWTRGKCGYKLIQYMACGLPVVASPVGVNTEIVEHGVNGFLASCDAEWREALKTLLADPQLRRSMGAAGRRKVEEAYSLGVWGPRVAGLLSDVARAG